MLRALTFLGFLLVIAFVTVSRSAQARAAAAQPATCNPCMSEVAPLKAAYKKNPKDVVQIWGRLCRAMGKKGKGLSDCLKVLDTKPGREVAAYNLGDGSVTPVIICAGYKLCNYRWL